MAKQNWKPGNMLYPLPAVMVSCQSSTAHDSLCEKPELDGKPNIITVAWPKKSRRKAKQKLSKKERKEKIKQIGER